MRCGQTIDSVLRIGGADSAVLHPAWKTPLPHAEFAVNLVNSLLYWALRLWLHPLVFLHGFVTGDSGTVVSGQCGNRTAPTSDCHTTALPGRPHTRARAVGRRAAIPVVPYVVGVAHRAAICRVTSFGDEPISNRPVLKFFPVGVVFSRVLRKTKHHKFCLQRATWQPTPRLRCGAARLRCASLTLPP